MSIAKHSLELRLKAVKHYLSGKDGQRQTASLFGVGRTALRRWVIAYQYHGIDGLTWKNDKYPTDFKLKVVMAVINDNLSLREATGLFNLSSGSVVYQWVKLFESSGPEALKSSRGRKRTKMKSTVEQSTSKPLENLTPEEMQAELRFLRAKVEYLKKLKALVQKKKKQ